MPTISYKYYTKPLWVLLFVVVVNEITIDLVNLSHVSHKYQIYKHHEGRLNRRFIT